MTKKEIKAERKLKIKEFSKQRQEEFVSSRENIGVSPLKAKQVKFAYASHPDVAVKPPKIKVTYGTYTHDYDSTTWTT